MTESLPQPLATVTICTRNRADSLARTLDSIVAAAAKVPKGLNWEMIVVDNGSTDHTSEVIGRYATCLPVQRILQEIPGLSNARNAGVAAARGEFIIWTDDDVQVDENWLASYLTAMTDHPDVDIFGGRATPVFETPQEDWFIRLKPHMGSLLAVRDNPDWTVITPDQLPYGLNYSVRTSLQKTFPYDPGLGVAPGRRIGGEETGMMQEAMRAGATGLWVWNATVYHLIPPHRQSLTYVYDYYFSQGVVFPKVPIGQTGLARLRHFGYLAYRITRRRINAIRLRRQSNDLWILSYMDYARLLGSWSRLRANNVDFT